MNLIKQLNNTPLILEDDGGACTSAGSVASAPMPLLSKMISRKIPSKPKIIKFGSIPYNKPKSTNLLSVKSIFNHLSEDFGTDKPDSEFDTTSVISKLKGLENKEQADIRNSVTFGLVDANGNIVRVTIPRDQSESFEQELQNAMMNKKDSEPTKEIAEILFKLKNNYNIINVEWPDEENEEQDSENSELTPPENEDNIPPEDSQDPASEIPPIDETPPPSANTDQVSDLLTQVISMMKADAEARKADALARSAESKNKQAMSARDLAMARVKQEEQILDMDQYNKRNKDRDKEANRLAKLAKWKNDLENEPQENDAEEPKYSFLPGPENKQYRDIGKGHSRSHEEEEYRRPQQKLSGKVTPSDIAKYITNRIK